MATILGANEIKSTGYDVANSLRFNDGDSAYLHFTPSSAGNRRTMTLSVWFKGASLADGTNNILGQYNSSNENNSMLLTIESNGRIMVWNYTTSAYTMNLRTNALLLDPSAWYHVVVAVDTTQATESNRVKIYLNGTQQTSFSASTYPSQNLELFMNQDKAQNIGTQRYGSTVGSPFDGYMAEFAFIDGTQYAASDFGEFDEDSPNIWKPKDISELTFGTNGYYLDFEDSGSLGNDVSGNNNDFTPVNFAATDQSTDTCTNNFATLNPQVFEDGAITYSEGNLKAVAGSGSASWTTRYAFSSIGVSSGRWYVEGKCVDSGVGPQQFYFGIAKDVETWSFNSSLGYEDTGQGWGYYANDGNIVNNGSDLYTSGNSYTDGDIIGMELDLEDMTLDFYKNGVKEGYQVTSLPAGTYHFAINGYQAIDGEFNFGSPPHAISSGNSDGNGYGNFEYSVPSGHYALNTKNLAQYG